MNEEAHEEIISPLLAGQKNEKAQSLISLRTSRLNSESQTTNKHEASHSCEKQGEKNT